MGIIDRILGREPADAKSLTVTGMRLQPVGVNRIPDTPPSGIDDLLGFYRGNALVKACVTLKGNSAAEPRLIVQERNNENEWEEVQGHPMRRLLRRPNPQMGEADFFSFAQRSMDVSGVFYSEIVRSDAGLPVELYPLQPQKVKTLTTRLSDGSMEITGYEYQDGSYRMRLPPENMLVRDDMELGGQLSPLAAAVREVDLDSAQTDFLRGFFNNAGVPSGLLKIKNRSLQPDEAEEIRATWRARHGRQFGNLHEVSVLDENADYERIGSLLSELDSETMRGFTESRITMGFGVPPLIVYAYFGLIRATYNNLPEAWRQFWTTTMSAELRGWNSFFELALLPEYVDYEQVLGEKVRLYWDKSEVDALQENVDNVHDRARKNFQASGTSLNEFRAAIGYDEHEEVEFGSQHYIEIATEMAAAGKQLAYGTVSPAAEDEDAKAAELHAMLLKAKRQAMVKEKEQQDIEDEAIQAYGEEIFALADRAREGDISQDDFVSQLRALSDVNLTAFFLMGMLFDDDGELTDDEWEALAEHVSAAQDSAETFAEDIYMGRYGGKYAEEGDEGADLDNRVYLWGAAGATVLVLGRVHRRDDPYLQWQLGFTEEHCSDCAGADGMVMTASEWRRSGLPLPKSRDLECAGYYCDCDLVEVIVEGV